MNVLIYECRWLIRIGCIFPGEVLTLVDTGQARREDILEKDYGNGDGIVLTRFYRELKAAPRKD